MHTDVNDLDAFYASPLGKVVRLLIGRILRERWENCAGLSVVGYGYCAPYLERFRDEARCALALMPAQQGVVAWPSTSRCASALVMGEMLPLPDASVERVLVAHGLETAEHPSDLLEEICRVLAPEGRALIIVPSRRGVWARVDGTPFGQGQPFSKSQLRDLVRDTVFSPIYWGEALYMPPLTSRFLMKSAAPLERVGAALGLPFAGVHVLEAVKQVYRPISVRRVQRAPVVALRPALAPHAHREGG